MWRRLALLSVALQLGGCAYLASVSGHLGQQVDRWDAHQQYGESLAALSYVKPTDPNYRHLMAKRVEVEALAHRYAREIVSKADRLARQGQWAQALHEYDEAQARLPQSTILRRGRARLERLQRAQLADINLNLLIARGESIQRQLPYYSAIARTNPRSSEAQQQLERVRHEAEQIAAQLVKHGRDALNRGALATARRTLPLALRLAPSPAVRQANQELLRRLAPKGATGAGNGTGRGLLRQYRQALRHNDLVEAQRLLSLLELEPTASPHLAQLRNDLNDRITEAVHGYVDRGTSLYSRGKYEAALLQWRKAQELDPDNDLVNGHIARAERVLQKLQSLKQKQDADTAP